MGVYLRGVITDVYVKTFLIKPFLFALALAAVIFFFPDIYFRHF